MNKKNWSLALFLLSQWIAPIKMQGFGNIINLESFGAPDFVNANCWPERLKNDNFISTTVPAWSCNSTLYGNLTCDSVLHWTVIIVDHNGNDMILDEDNDTITNCLEKSKGSITGAAVESIRECIKRPHLCPITGDFYLDKCRLNLGNRIPSFAKQFKIIFRFSQKGREVFGFKLRLEVDDTEILRAKRPTAGQKKRRRQ